MSVPLFVVVRSASFSITLNSVSLPKISLIVSDLVIVGALAHVQFGVLQLYVIGTPLGFMYVG